jgi:hypothetical protein
VANSSSVVHHLRSDERVVGEDPSDVAGVRFEGRETVTEELRRAGSPVSSARATASRTLLLLTPR